MSTTEIQEQIEWLNKNVWFDCLRAGWHRYGQFFPLEAFGNGPFFHGGSNAIKSADVLGLTQKRPPDVA